MSGEKRASISIVPLVATGLATVCVGTGAVVIKSGIAAANKLQIEGHRFAVRRSKKKLKNILQNEAMELYASKKEKMTVQDQFNQIELINEPNDVNKSRAADAQAAEYLSKAQEAARPAILKYELKTICDSIRDSLGKYNHLNLKVQKRFETVILQQIAEIEKNETIVSVETDIRKQLEKCQSRLVEFKQCADEFILFKEYEEKIRVYEWAKDLTASPLQALAGKSDLTVEAIKNEYLKFQQTASQLYDQRIKHRKKQEKEKQEILVKFGNKLNELTDGIRRLSDKYYNHAHSDIQDARSILDEAKMALYKNDTEKTRQLISKLESHISTIPEAAKQHQMEEEKKTSERNDFIDQVKLFLVELEKSELPAYAKKSCKKEIENVDERLQCLNQKPLKEFTAGMAKLNTDIGNLKKRLTFDSIEGGIRTSIESFRPDDKSFEWDLQSMNDFKNKDIREEEIRLIAKTKDEQRFIVDYSMEGERLKLDKVDDGDGVTCDFYKDLLKWIDKDTEGLVSIDAKDRHGNPLELDKGKTTRKAEVDNEETVFEEQKKMRELT